MDIKAADVKALRDKTGAGMMECKNALLECNGDAAAAAELLKEKGLAAVEKRVGRGTSEGRIFIKLEGDKAAILELNCETDFVSKNTDFLEAGNAILAEILSKGYTQVNETLSNMLLDLSTKIRENMSIRRLELVKVPNGSAVSSYVHTDKKTGVIVLLACDPVSSVENAEIKQFVFDCCLHIAAFSPSYVRREDVPADYIAKITKDFTEETAELDKPEKVKAGIVQGKINKHLTEICLMDQAFVKDDKVSLAKKLEQVAKDTNTKLSIIKIVNYQLGA